MEPDDLKSSIPLPDELLSKIIFQFIPLRQWLRCLESVSKQFQRCVFIAYSQTRSVNCRKLFSLREDEGHTYWRFNNILEKLLTVCPNLADIARLDFVTSYMCGISKPWDILVQFDHLRSISLTNIRDIVFRSFANFVENSKSLKILNVTNCHFDSCGNLNVGSLCVVNFLNMGLLDGKPPKISLENLSEKLTALTLHSVEYGIKNDPNAMKNCTNLESFSVSLFTKNDYEIFKSALPNLCKLTTLCITGHHRSWLRSFSVQYCEQLSLLKNRLQCVEFDDVDVSKEVYVFLLAECTQLKSLKIGGRCGLSANVFENLHRFPELQKLTFSNTDGVILPILLPKLVNLTNLTDLTISSGVYDVKEFENIYCLVNLQNLRLEGSSGINDALLVTVDKKNPEIFEKLVSLQLSIASNISDRGAVLVAKKARNLKILHLPNSEISEKTISVLSDVAKNLTEIDFNQSYPLFDENAVIALIKNVICMKKVKVNGKLVNRIRKNENLLPFAENVDFGNYYISPFMQMHQ